MTLWARFPRNGLAFLDMLLRWMASTLVSWKYHSEQIILQFSTFTNPLRCFRSVDLLLSSKKSHEYKKQFAPLAKTSGKRLLKSISESPQRRRTRDQLRHPGGSDQHRGHRDPRARHGEGHRPADRHPGHSCTPG